MLECVSLSKTYVTGMQEQRALNQVSLSFRDREFVSILGQSGSGKTTLLNMIGGLDRYDSGDLLVDGRSTKEFSERDWDDYRCRRVGFVFQNYSLIPHQSVLANVELALTIAGVGRAERRRRAREVLTEVGLKEHLHKRPNQLSGGQMQRVAIARALINDPQILLADEPTGALDSETGAQVVEMLKKVAEKRLVVMVTHNARLAEQYSTRIVRLLDGRVVDDSHPFEAGRADAAPEAAKGHSGMSFLTSLALSLSNLRTKKGRTILTALAGSVGIAGIALILSLSGGVNRYIDNLEKETMTSYPIVISSQSFDIGSVMQMGRSNIEKKLQENSQSGELSTIKADFSQMNADREFSLAMKQNDLAAFKAFLDDPARRLDERFGAGSVFYSYQIPFRVLSRDSKGRLVDSAENPYLAEVSGNRLSSYGPQGNSSVGDGTVSGAGNFQELIPGAGEEAVSKVLTENLELLAGHWPERADEVLLHLDSNGALPVETLYQLGLVSVEDFFAVNAAIREEREPKMPEWKVEDLLGREFLLVPAFRLYGEENGVFSERGDSGQDREELARDAIPLKVSAVVRKKAGMIQTPLREAVGYTSLLTEQLMEMAAESAIVRAQLADPEINVLSGKAFDEGTGFLSSLIPAGQKEIFSDLFAIPSLEENLKHFGYADRGKPDSINIYVKSFEAKEDFNRLIEEYNLGKEEKEQVAYTDFIAVMTSSMTTVINTISYVLIAFVAISLIVSSLMIGVITHISVLERTREIGILRALGASRRNVSRVFNAETVIIGFFSGMLGVLSALLLTWAVNPLIHRLVGDARLSAGLPPLAALALVAVSVFITLIGGAIPARRASRRDPVAALRSE